MLNTVLPEGLRLAAADVSAAMPAQLRAGQDGPASLVVPLLAGCVGVDPGGRRRRR